MATSTIVKKDPPELAIFKNAQKIYGKENLCKNCGVAPILREPIKDTHERHYNYHKRKPGLDGKTEKEIMTVTYPSEHDPLGLCYYCRKIYDGLIDGATVRFGVQMREQVVRWLQERGRTEKKKGGK